MDLEEDLSDEFESKSTKAVQNGSQVSRKVLREDNECQFCNKCYKSRRSLQMHKRTCSKNPERKKPSPVSCSLCKTVFSRTFALERHISAKRCSANPSNSAKLKARHFCLMSDCDLKFYHKTALISHLKESHGADILPMERLTFADWDAFTNWKSEEERQQLSYFSEQFGQKEGHYYFYCQQDGPRRSHPTKPASGDNEVEAEDILEDEPVRPPKRKKKSCNIKGRIKNNAICIAMMKVEKTEEGVVVEYHPTHIHELHAADLKHQPLSDASNSYIKKYLQLGVSPRKILKVLRGDKFCRINRSNQVELTRDDFINLKTLRERQRKMAVEKSFNPDDATAVRMLVDFLLQEPYNSVLIYKPYGCKLFHGPDSASSLPLDIFMLGLQTKEQGEMMQMASSTILIVDATHDMDQYGCQLLNVVGVDELNRGYPLAHCISSKMDESTLQHFFAAIKERFPDMIINCVITDDDPALINAMNAGFQESLRHILCDWHFKRTLQKELHSKVRNSHLEDEMFKELCVLIDAQTESDFEKLLKAFVKKYKPGDFVAYFEIYCVPKKMKWAKCFRRFPHGDVDTTMYVESFHNLVKTIYLKRKPNKRVESAANLLLEVEEDYFARRMTSILIVAPREQQLKDISERHIRGMSIPDDDVKEYDENGSKHWTVKSSGSDEICYHILRSSNVCTRPDMCFFHCVSNECHENLCAHMYLCTCPDEVLLCKHIHKVHSKYYDEPPPVPESVPDVEFHYRHSLTESTDETDKLRHRCEKEQEEILSLMSKLKINVESDPVKTQVLHSFIKRTLQDLVAKTDYLLSTNECEEDSVPMQPVVHRTSREKLQRQLPRFKKFKASRKNKKQSRIPKIQERAEIREKLLSALSSSSEDSFSEDDTNVANDVPPSSSVVDTHEVGEYCEEVNTNAILNKGKLILKPRVKYVARPVFQHGKPSKNLLSRHNPNVK